MNGACVRLTLHVTVTVVRYGCSSRPVFTAISCVCVSRVCECHLSRVVDDRHRGRWRHRLHEHWRQTLRGEGMFMLGNHGMELSRRSCSVEVGVILFDIQVYNSHLKNDVSEVSTLNDFYSFQI